MDAVVMNKLGKGWETGLRRHKVLRITRMITFGTDDDFQNDDDEGIAKSHMSILLALLYPVVVDSALKPDNTLHHEPWLR